MEDDTISYKSLVTGLYRFAFEENILLGSMFILAFPVIFIAAAILKIRIWVEEMERR